MAFAEHLFIIFLLIVISAFFSISEISLAASRKTKLRVLAEGGDENAARVLALQDSPGYFFTVVQIGLNAVAILGGVVGEQSLTPYVRNALQPFYDGPRLDTASFLIAFALVTSVFVLFADLMPKRIGMAAPERIAVAVVRPMQACMWLFGPLVWIFNGLANWLFRVTRLPTVRIEQITAEDIMAMADAGAQSGMLLKQEQQMISKVFELDERIVPSAMTNRDSIVFLTLGESEESIRRKIAAHPHGKYPVCRDGIDQLIGYVDSKDILPRILEGKPLGLRTEPIVRNALVLPDTLSLFEALERFRDAKEDFALAVNEYALVVGLLTLQDVMNTVMGGLSAPYQEDMIVRRDDHSWLIDGSTPIEDVMSALEIAEFEGFENYETIAGFLMYTLRKVPRRTDFVIYAGYKFEVVDIDSYRIDQVLATRAEERPETAE
ncbi:MAG: HlyC/CorC family transporter [Thauera phenolivorans]|uniref:Polyamine export protein n=1 Tax=Thauera phenolivorans TaxID=1792543 RepID=A0A7X7LY46_9RHOO|nr:hemolysin family protein [Thauera phenolivorans]NLF55026.1 HlyC/CorC family transporter [Thauera phenolivorans]